MGIAATLESQISALVEALGKEKDGLSELLAVLDAQQDRIFSHDGEGVLAASERIETRMDEARGWREEREALQRELGHHLDLGGTSDLLVIANALPTDVGDLIRLLLNQSNHLLATARHRARENQVLMGKSIDLMEALANTFSDGHHPRLQEFRGLAGD